MRLAVLVFVMSIAIPTFAKEQERAYSKSCEEVWTAVKVVAGTGRYRILSVDKDDRIISFAVGGWAGVRELSAHLQGDKQSCTISIQSRFTGLVHHDAPDFLKRVDEQLATKNAAPPPQNSPWNYADPTKNPN